MQVVRIKRLIFGEAAVSDERHLSWPVRLPWMMRYIARDCPASKFVFSPSFHQPILSGAWNVHSSSTNALQPPPFEALSYVWGRVNRRVKIQCNGHTVKVTGNLHRALVKLRLSDARRTVWHPRGEGTPFQLTTPKASARCMRTSLLRAFTLQERRS